MAGSILPVSARIVSRNASRVDSGDSSLADESNARDAFVLTSRLAVCRLSTASSF